MILRQFAILTVGCLSLTAVAQAPVERPANANADAGTAPVRPAGRPGITKLIERGEKDLPDALAFFREHCPKLAAAYDKLPEEKQKEFRPMILGRYYASKMAADGSELKAVKLRQMEVEDRLFDVKNRLMDAQEKNSPDVETLKTELRQAVVDLVGAKMEERRLRIARLEKLLSEERADLEKDQAHEAEMVDKRYQEVLDAKRPDPMAARHSRGDGDHPKRPDADRSKRPDSKPK
ncbi:MAG: hypothetical protein ABSH20_23645 [Tepidisphaeraceae bacterium]|jgi:hypothetical protein